MGERIHELKVWPTYFSPLHCGLKTFEIRKNDRKFEPRDLLYLREWDPDSGEYTKRGLVMRIGYLTEFGQQEDQVVMTVWHEAKPCPFCDVVPFVEKVEASSIHSRSASADDYYQLVHPPSTSCLLTRNLRSPLAYAEGVDAITYSWNNRRGSGT